MRHCLQKNTNITFRTGSGSENNEEGFRQKPILLNRAERREFVA